MQQKYVNIILRTCCLFEILWSQEIWLPLSIKLILLMKNMNGFSIPYRSEHRRVVQCKLLYKIYTGTLDSEINQRSVNLRMNFWCLQISQKANQIFDKFLPYLTFRLCISQDSARHQTDIKQQLQYFFFNFTTFTKTSKSA